MCNFLLPGVASIDDVYSYAGKSFLYYIRICSRCNWIIIVMLSSVLCLMATVCTLGRYCYCVVYLWCIVTVIRALRSQRNAVSTLCILVHSWTFPNIILAPDQGQKHSTNHIMMNCSSTKYLLINQNNKLRLHCSGQMITTAADCRDVWEAPSLTDHWSGRVAYAFVMSVSPWPTHSHFPSPDRVSHPNFPRRPRHQLSGDPRLMRVSMEAPKS